MKMKMAVLELIEIIGWERFSFLGVMGSTLCILTVLMFAFATSMAQVATKSSELFAY